MEPRLMKPKFSSILLVVLGLSFLLVSVACSEGLGTQKAYSASLAQSSAGAPGEVEPVTSGVPYPLGLPSALKGRSVYQSNCASCHGTYLTAVEKLSWEAQKNLPQDQWSEVTKQLVSENRQPNNPLWERKVNPDFYSTDWRFEKSPGELFRLIETGKDRFGRLHPGPSGKMGEGWKGAIKDNRGTQLVATGDPIAIWNVVFYVWSRSIAGASPTRFTEAWSTYSQNCNVCHGTLGKGDGPLHKTLQPLPFNFQNYKAMAETTDTFLYWRISEGGQWTSIPESIQRTMTPEALKLYVHQWSSMPAWKGILTEQERWLAVDGVRSRTYEHE